MFGLAGKLIIQLLQLSLPYKLFGILSKNGLAPINKISELVSKTTSKKVKASMKVLSMEYESNESENTVDFNQMTEMVEDLICDELLGSIEKRYPSLASNLEDILNVMYNCSAIGHTYDFREDNSTRVIFKYRNRVSKFSIRDKIIIHNGLWQSLNVNY